MALVWLILFVFVQSPIIPASRLLKHGDEDCGAYSISHSGDPSRELFYIDGKLVDRDFFCESLGDYGEKHCFLTKDVKKHYCLSIDKLSLLAERKYVNTVVGEGSSRTDNDDMLMGVKGKDNNSILSKPEMLTMGVPAFFLFCCALICPCFQARKKDDELTVLTKEPSSMGSVSSLEMKQAFGFRGSPQRMPPSPLRAPPTPSRFSMSPKPNSIEPVHLNMRQVMQATNRFSESLRIGGGGFGDVYKAELKGGQVVAIKRAKKEHLEALSTEFRSEVELLAKIDHRCLVKLLGCVEKGNERLIITEYVPNGTLREHLDGMKGKILDFSQRLEISIDIAHGLTHLHTYAEKQIIHRDVKSSNILLTESYRAKVADFGFAKLGDDSDRTQVTRVKGTVGYLDPEYMKTNRLTAKSDVYSFGVLLLEILTGRRPVELKRGAEEKATVKWAFRKYRKGRFTEMVDPAMGERIDNGILTKMFDLAFQCVAPTKADRPDMKTVSEQLWSIRMEWNEKVNGL